MRNETSPEEAPLGLFQITFIAKTTILPDILTID